MKRTASRLFQGAQALAAGRQAPAPSTMETQDVGTVIGVESDKSAEVDWSETIISDFEQYDDKDVIRLKKKIDVLYSGGVALNEHGEILGIAITRFKVREDTDYAYILPISKILERLKLTAKD